MKNQDTANWEDCVAKAILNWYGKNRRIYPFRQTHDPYRLLITCILLNRTTIEQVSSIYCRFFDTFPRVEDLAGAKEDEVLDIIRPLGISRRAKRLIEVAKHIVSQHGSKVPSDVESLLAIKGVGSYCAGVVLAFAYGKNVAMIDSNVERVIGRLKGIEKPDSKKKEEISKVYVRMAPENHIRDFHCALIDLSHMNCRPKSPSCASCCLSPFCPTAHTLVAAGKNPSGGK